MQTGDITASGGAAAARSWRRALELTAPITRQPALTFPLALRRIADAAGDAPALLSERQTLTHRDLAARIDHYANWALDAGLAPGEVVCLLMPNCPEYLAIWAGVIRVGAVVALVNTNLVGDALRHAIDSVGPRHIIVAAELAGAVEEVRRRVAGTVGVWVHGGGAPGWPRIDAGAFAGRGEYPAPTLSDRALYIYTSGTTGLPKAASVSHYRLMQWTHWFAGLIGAAPEDRMYNCLPMYHSVGGVVATGAALVGGGSAVIRERFSARRFWDDIARWDCTLFQYIGDLCRYLVAAPAHPLEASHRLRLACGNGLRADVWEAFEQRFHIPRIIEFYAATESDFSLYNCEGRRGAVGRVPFYLTHRYPVALVKTDTETGDPVRGIDGFCIRCEADEAGEAIAGLAGNSADIGVSFEGYTDEDASARKILRNVFAVGDAWYRTGDLMRRDRAGFFYFVDRLGDTFRWKGENVSAGEVENTIATFPGIEDCAAYGVAVPGCEGRAGMAAIVTGGEFGLADFASHLAANLPSYARPVFVRRCERIAVTGTFRPQRQALAREGFAPDATADELYVYDRRENRYLPLDAARFQAIQRGEMRL